MKRTTLFLASATVLAATALVGGHANADTGSIYRQPSGVGTFPVYSIAKGNDHYLTMYKTRADQLVAQNGYNSEKIAFYSPDVSSSGMGDSWYNNATQQHYFTIDQSGTEWFKDDSKTLRIKSLGYHWTGSMLFYDAKGDAANGVGSVPVYVSYNSSGNHYYSVNSALPAGYVNQSIAWYDYDGPNVGQLISNGTSSSSSSTPTTTTTPTMGSADISNISAPTAIQTNMTVSGSGQGFHAKVSFNTATAAVSFGIQYDAHGAAPYTGKPSFLIENISSAATEAGNTYTHTGAAQTGTSYKVLLTVTSNGTVTAYVNGTKVGQVTNAGLANTTVYARVQAVGDVNGDVFNATFANTQVKENGSIQNAQTSAIYPNGGTTNTSVGQATPTITIGGKVAGFSGNWSTANPYGDTVQFQ